MQGASNPLKLDSACWARLAITMGVLSSLLPIAACSGHGIGGGQIPEACGEASDAFQAEKVPFEDAINATTALANRWTLLINGISNKTLSQEEAVNAKYEFSSEREEAQARFSEVDWAPFDAAYARCNQSEVPDDCLDLFAQYKLSADAAQPLTQASMRLIGAADAVDASIAALTPLGTEGLGEDQAAMTAFITASDEYSVVLDNFSALSEQWWGMLDAVSAAVDKCNARSGRIRIP